MKKLICLLLTLIMMFSMTSQISVTAASPEINVVVNGSKVLFADVKPQLIDGRTMVPLRAVFEKMGCNVEWSQKNKSISISLNGNTLILAVNSSNIILNNVTLSQKLDVPAQLVSSRTMLPLRFAAEALGFKVRWDNTSRTVYVTGTGLNSTNANTEAKNIFKMIGGTDKSKVGEWFKGNLNAISSLNSSLNDLKSAHAKVDAIYSGGLLLIDCVNVSTSIAKGLKKGSTELTEAIFDAQQTMLSYTESETMSVQDYFTGLGKSSFYSAIELSEVLLTLHIARIERGFFDYDSSIAYATCYYLLMTDRTTMSAAVELLLEEAPSNVLEAGLLTTQRFVFSFFPNALSGNIENLLDLNSDAIRGYYTSINRYRSKLQTILY